MLIELKRTYRIEYFEEFSFEDTFSTQRAYRFRLIPQTDRFDRLRASIDQRTITEALQGVPFVWMSTALAAEHKATMVLAFENKRDAAALRMRLP